MPGKFIWHCPKIWKGGLLLLQQTAFSTPIGRWRTGALMESAGVAFHNLKPVNDRFFVSDDSPTVVDDIMKPALGETGTELQQ